MALLASSWQPYLRSLLMLLRVVALPRTVCSAVYFAIAATAFASTAAAQGVPAAGGISITALKDKLANAQARQDLAPELKGQIVDAYRNAVAALEDAAGLRAELAQTRAAQAGAQQTMQALERQLRALRAELASPEQPGALDALPLGALEGLERRAREETSQARQRAAELQLRFDDIVARPLTATLEQAELRAATASRDAQGGEPPGSEVPAALAAAQQDLARAAAASRRARLAHVEQELVAQPVLADIAQLELQVAQATLDARAAQQARVRAALEKRQRAEIASAREEAARLRRAGAASTDPASALRARILERRAQIAEVALATRTALATLAQHREQLAEIERTLRATELRAAGATEGDELERLLLGQIATLPAPDQFRKAAETRAEAIAQAADARLAVELERARVANPLGAAGPALRADRAELQRLLQRLDGELDVLLQTLRATDGAEATMLRHAQEFRAELIRLLLWIPVSPLGLETFGDIGPAAGWLLAADNWRGVADTWLRAAQRAPARLPVAALFLAALLAARGWFRRRLPTLAPGAMPPQSFGARHTLEALALSLLLALPLPFVLWTAGFMLEATRDASLFAQSAGNALRLAAEVLLFFRVLRWLFDDGGVAIRHFSWHAEPVLAARRALQQLMALYVPLMFVTALATSQAPEAVRQSLGRIAFVLAMIVAAVFWRRAFPPGRVLARLERDESTLGLRLIFGAVTRAPVWLGLALAAAALAGFYFLAAFLLRLLLETILLVFAVSMAYGLIALWIATQRRRLAEVEAQQARASAQQGRVLAEELPAVRPPEIDAKAIDRQTRQLLNLLMTIVLGAGLWLIWSGAFAAMDLGADVALWSYADTVGGKAVTRTITLSGLLLALAVGIVAYIGTRNAGGMLDILLLQRLRLEADANYAIKTIARYATAGIGVVVAASLIGVSWSSVQWLVAALGVGLGFGLQEIVANFVSGLIILGERPVRVGDVVTVGETTGTVARIRARATVITDWDNKEVMIPNKAFITERVMNWTLSNQTTRLLLKIGVAYGTDPARAEKVLADAVRANPNVLAEPAPSVYFMGFGDSSLDFEIRAYVDATSKRLRTTHELNIAIAGALAAAGIQIPFPQRDVHIRTKS